MVEMVLISWRDIPSQVLLKKGRVKAKALLEDRFQQAIDRAAMRAKKAGADAYIEEWQRSSQQIECEGDLDECAHAKAQEISAEFSPELLEAYIRNQGIKPSSSGG